MKRVVHDETTVVPGKGTKCTVEEGRTRQEDADAADINVIMRRVELGGLIPPLRGGGMYADVSAIGDLRESLEQVRVAREAFDALPAEVRSAFGNEVAAFVDAFQTEEGVAKLRELKVIPETEETLLERREAAMEERAERRREARELAKRVEAARKPLEKGTES